MAATLREITADKTKRVWCDCCRARRWVVYRKIVGVVGVVLIGVIALPVQAAPQLVRADAVEQLERCLAAGGRAGFAV